MTIDLKTTATIRGMGVASRKLDAENADKAKNLAQAHAKALKAAGMTLKNAKNEYRRAFVQGYVITRCKPRTKNVNAAVNLKWFAKTFAHGAERSAEENAAKLASNTAWQRVINAAFPSRPRGNQGGRKGANAGKGADKGANAGTTSPEQQTSKAVVPTITTSKSAPKVAQEAVMALLGAMQTKNRKVCQTKAWRDMSAEINAVFEKYAAK